MRLPLLQLVSGIDSTCILNCISISHTRVHQEHFWWCLINSSMHVSNIANRECRKGSESCGNHLHTLCSKQHLEINKLRVWQDMCTNVPYQWRLLFSPNPFTYLCTKFMLKKCNNGEFLKHHFHFGKQKTRLFKTLNFFRGKKWIWRMLEASLQIVTNPASRMKPNKNNNPSLKKSHSMKTICTVRR